jgi:hypothetical protein
MNPEDFEKKMENLKMPGTEALRSPMETKLAIVGAQRSAAMGIWFIAIPCYFLFCVFMKYYFHINLGIFDTMVEMMSDLDKNPTMRFLSPILMVGLPLVGIVLNALAITHFAYLPSSRVLQVSIKVRWVNLAILLLSLGLVAIFVLYAIVENLHHAQIKTP